jgi:hypothetical protein
VQSTAQQLHLSAYAYLAGRTAVSRASGSLCLSENCKVYFDAERSGREQTGKLDHLELDLLYCTPQLHNKFAAGCNSYYMVSVYDWWTITTSFRFYGVQVCKCFEL